MTPAISIIMPVHNAAATLAASVASVQAQSVRNWELIIIDDGSRDDSLALAMALAAGDDRIRLVATLNGGPARARNLAAGLARAPLIAFLDADDLWAATKLARHLALHAARPGLAGSFGRIGFLPQHGTDLAACRTLSGLPAGPLRLIDVLGENPVCTMSNLVVRRDAFQALGGMDPGLSHAEDQALVAAIIAAGGELGAIDALLVGYRFSPDGLSMDLDAMKAGWRRVAARHLAGPALARQEALYCRYLARRSLRSAGRPGRALHHVWTGLRLDAAAFLADRRRGLATIAGALAAPLLPRPLRTTLFA